jgi:hypothetical protein
MDDSPQRPPEPFVRRARRASTGDHGVALPPFIDHHVHLHLVPGAALVAGGIAAVLDLGGDPIVLARRAAQGFPHVAFAGAFLTAPGGYPADRSWAPPAIVREVSSASLHPGAPGGAATAVDEQASCGASVVKVALHADAGPVFDAATLGAVVAAARERGLPVVAHVEGEGMLRLALDAGVDALAHTPFTEVAAPDLIARAVASGQRWITTLDIHRDSPAVQARAVDNLRAFAAAGGAVLYGTDLGNGDLPAGVNAREVAAMVQAGLSPAAIMRAFTDPWPTPDVPSGVSTFVPGDPPDADVDLPGWLAGAVVVPTEELIHDEH